MKQRLRVHNPDCVAAREPGGHLATHMPMLNTSRTGPSTSCRSPNTNK